MSLARAMQKKYLKNSCTVKLGKYGTSLIMVSTIQENCLFCVVFDCGATFQGTSLINKLLQGPNLTSSFLEVLTHFRQ